MHKIVLSGGVLEVEELTRIFQVRAPGVRVVGGFGCDNIRPDMLVTATGRRRAELQSPWDLLRPTVGKGFIGFVRKDREDSIVVDSAVVRYALLCIEVEHMVARLRGYADKGPSEVCEIGAGVGV